MNEGPSHGSSAGSENARSILLNMLRALPLEEHFSRATLKAAEPLVLLKQAWREPLGWFQPPGSSADALQCEFVEADGVWRLVEVYLYRLFGEVRLESRCGCRQPLCPHAAAMLLRLRQLFDWPRALTPLERWRLRLDDALEPIRATRPKAPAPSRSLVCVLHVNADAKPAHLFARLMLARLERGEIGAMTALEDAQSEEPVDPRAAMWQARLAGGRPSDPRSEFGHRLQGAAGASLLDEMLKSEICLHAETRQRLYAAGARPAPWSWTRDTLAQAHLTLDWGEDEVKVIDVHGLRYLNETTGEVGALKLSRQAYAMVLRMPPIPPGEKDPTLQWPPHPAFDGVPAPPADPPLREIHARMTPVLVVSGSKDAETGQYVFYVLPLADYAGSRLPLAGDSWQERIVRPLRGEYVCIQREVEREVAAARRLAAAELVSLRRLLPEGTRGLSPLPDPASLAHRQYHRGGAEVFTAFVASLGATEFQVEYDSELPFSVLPSDTELTATFAPPESAGWTQFELAASFDGGEINILPTVLDGLARKAFSLIRAPNEPSNAHWLAPITPDRFLPLSLEQLREWLGPLLDCQGRARDHEAITLTQAQALALGEALEEREISMRGALAARVSETLAALRAAQNSVALLDPPSAFRGTLRAYQREGLRWLQVLRQSELGGILADDMGLGKTVQVIAHLACEMQGGRLKEPALIVVPTSLVFNWLDELSRFAPDLRCVNFTGPERVRLRSELRDAHVIIVSYALLGIELEALEDIAYAMLVLDEAQWIKNPSTQTARAVRVLSARHRLVVSGTPLENHLGELWAHMDAVMPGYLGDIRTFNRSFRLPIERGGDDVRMKLLRQRVAPFLLRRTKRDVAPELPAKTETVLRVAMGEGQRRLYESLRLALSQRVREAIATYNDERSRIVVLSALLRLRQVCCDPRLLDAQRAGDQSAKLDALLELIDSLQSDDLQILIFSQFTTMLDLISQALDARALAHAVLTGRTSDRRAPVARFQNGEVKILLASLKAGGVGLNLTAADAVIHYDPWWNPAVEQQAEDRAHRIGRDRPVFIYKLICDDTIEDKIESMKSRKSDLASALLQSGNSPASLSAADVRLLFDLAASGAT
jgi:superfamily II DNA or RNA helicase